MIQDSIVFEGIYFNEAGFEYSPAELREHLNKYGPFPVYSEAGDKIGTMLQMRRVDGCLEALIETGDTPA